MWPRRAPARRLIATGRRRRRRRSDKPLVTKLRDVQFGSAEIPMASVHSIEGAFHRWADVRLAWLRPRALPAFVAVLALIGLIAVTQHLPHLAASAVVSR
jgi:hypothetical protein